TEMYTVCSAAFVSAWLVSQTVSSQTYNSTMAIFEDIVRNGVYNTDVRPLKDQSKIMNVTANFQLVSIVGIDDVAQSFTINGFVLFTWKDE
ncbi:acetylcholine receptor subunit alpha, partial [Biomphalaria glabrata]